MHNIPWPTKSPDTRTPSSQRWSANNSSAAVSWKWSKLATWKDGVVIMAGQPTYSPPVTYLNKGLTRAYSKEIPKQKLWVKSLLGIFQGYVGKILDSWLFFFGFQDSSFKSWPRLEPTSEESHRARALLENKGMKDYLDLPKGAKWCLKGVKSPSVRV